MKATVNRKISLWIQDEYDVPEGTTEEELKKMDKNGSLEDYFKERDMFKFINEGDSLIDTGEVEYNIED